MSSPVRSPVRRRPPVPGVRVDYDVWLRARDGTRLCVDVYRPEDETSGPWPALYAVSPYQKDLAGLPSLPTYPWRETGPIEYYVQRGYVYVLGDARGTGKSEGRWGMLDTAEQTDLYDTIEWIAEQPWCDGKVGMIGQSYFGMNQWMAAIQRPPHLSCIAPYDASIDRYRENAMHGGIPCSGWQTVWNFFMRANHALGPAGVEALDKFEVDTAHAILEHPLDDDFWRERSPYWRLDEVTIPVLSIGDFGKNALHLRGNVVGYELVRGPKKLLLEAGARPQVLNVAKALETFESVKFHEKVLLPWYDHWLKGESTGVLDGDPVRYFVSGVDEYRSAAAWPPQATATGLFLAPGPAGAVTSLNDGALSPAEPDAAESSTSYEYPDPQWHRGTTMIDEHGRPHPTARILTFSTPPLERDLEVVGSPVLELYLSSDQVDTDVIVRLWDQPPADGPGEQPLGDIISRGWLRASHRSVDPQRSTPWRPFHDHRRPEPLEPGQVYRLEIELWPMAHVFRQGHRLRLEIANGDSPFTEGTFTHYYGLKYGRDTVHHDAGHPSHLRLPVPRR